MAHRHSVQRARGGGADSKDVYAGKDSNVVKEARSASDGFKKGGKVHGHKGKHRLDKRARGGRTGHSPFSSAKGKTGSPFSHAHHGHHHAAGPASHPEPHHSKTKADHHKASHTVRPT